MSLIERWKITVCREHGGRVGRGDQGEMLCPVGHVAREADYIEVVRADAYEEAVSTLEALEDALLRHFAGWLPAPGDHEAMQAAQRRALDRQRGQ